MCLMKIFPVLRVFISSKNLSFICYARLRAGYFYIKSSPKENFPKENNIFQSSKRSGNGIGIESVRHITAKNGGACDFTYEDGIFSAKIMLRV